MNIIDIDTEIKMHGYNPIDDVIKPNKNIIEFASFIEDLELEKKKCFLGQVTEQEVIANTKAFYNRHFKLNKVPYKSPLRARLDTPILRHIPGQEVPLKLHNSFIRYVHPFDLPLEFTSQDLIDCSVVENATFIDNDDFLSRMKISYSKIVLPSQVTDLTESSYVHELAHTQLAHRKGIIKNFYNREVVSIFIELLNIYESSKQDTILPLHNALRLTELYQDIYMLAEHHTKIKEYDREDLIRASIYLESILKAYGLFTEYINGSASLKKYILNCIQNIFNGDLQLEELIEEFELTKDNVSKDDRVKKVLSI